MLADDELREALTTRLPDLEPHVEAELDRLLARADALARRRRTVYVAGLVAAAVVAGGLVLGHDWRPGRHQPEPSDDVPARTQHAGARRGMYEDPAPWCPAATGRARSGRPTASPPSRSSWTSRRAGGRTTSTPSPPAPGQEDATRRIDLFADVRRIQVYRCSGETRIRPGPGALGLATAITSVPGGTGVGPHARDPRRVSRVPGPPRAVADAAGDQALRVGRRTSGVAHPGILRTYGMAGWTNLLWVLDVEGHQVLVNASHGRDATPAEQAELVGIVESISFVLP